MPRERDDHVRCTRRCTLFVLVASAAALISCRPAVTLHVPSLWLDAPFRSLLEDELPSYRLTLVAAGEETARWAVETKSGLILLGTERPEAEERESIAKLLEAAMAAPRLMVTDARFTEAAWGPATTPHRVADGERAEDIAAEIAPLLGNYASIALLLGARGPAVLSALGPRLPTGASDDRPLVYLEAATASVVSELRASGLPVDAAVVPDLAGALAEAEDLSLADERLASDETLVETNRTGLGDSGPRVIHTQWRIVRY